MLTAIQLVRPFRPLVVALVATGALLMATPASAVCFQYRLPAAGMTGTSTCSPAAAGNITELILSLVSNGGVLPAGEVSKPYNYSLSQLLSVTGDPNYSGSGVTWSILSGSLPPGLSLASNGVISGTPTTANAAGSSFQVKAAYKTATGQQAYTIVVNGAVLHVTQIAAGTYHTCAVTITGGAKCWGKNLAGELGIGSTGSQALTPVDVTGLSSGVASIAVGFGHTCAVTTGGGLKCWGDDGMGQLGDNAAKASRSTPTDVAGLTSGVAQVSAGSNHTCAVTTAGGLYCWGAGSSGQLGYGWATTYQPTPMDVSGLTSGVSRVSAGSYHTCALTTAGGLKCWGADGYGQLGNNVAIADQVAPVDVAGLTSGVTSVTTGGYHTCAITTGGGLMCWGQDTYGQLGDDGIPANKPTPVGVFGLTSGVLNASAGGVHTCAITASSALKCWGGNYQGELGINSVGNLYVPGDVVGLTSGVSSVSAGWEHTCAVTPAGDAKCWGWDSNGQLGDGAPLANKLVPVSVSP